MDDGTHIIVEMQNKRESHFEDRALYYACHSVVRQGERGDDWQYALAPVIGVYFLNFRQQDFGEAFRSDFAITKMDYATSAIAQCTGLSEKEIEELR